MDVSTGAIEALTTEVARLADQVRQLAMFKLISEPFNDTSPTAARPGLRVRSPRARPDYLRLVAPARGEARHA